MRGSLARGDGSLRFPPTIGVGKQSRVPTPRSPRTGRTAEAAVRRSFLAWSAGLAAVFVVLAIAVSSGMLRGIDAALMDFGRAHAPRRLKGLSTLIDRAQQADVQFLAMALVCLAIGRRDRHTGSLGGVTPLAV